MSACLTNGGGFEKAQARHFEWPAGRQAGKTRARHDADGPRQAGKTICRVVPECGLSLLSGDRRASSRAGGFVV